MVYHVCALYPNTQGAKFDMDYYLSIHMPLAEKAWTKAGLLKWDVTEPKPNADGTPPKYRILTVMTFESEEAWVTSSSLPESTEVFADIPKYTDIKHDLITGQIVGNSV